MGQVPKSYIDLQQAIIQEAVRRRSTDEPPILLEDEILQLAKSSPQNDILDTEELKLGWSWHKRASQRNDVSNDNVLNQ